jgi:hypothetical protein
MRTPGSRADSPDESGLEKLRVGRVSEEEMADPSSKERWGLRDGEGKKVRGGKAEGKTQTTGGSKGVDGVDGRGVAPRWLSGFLNTALAEVEPGASHGVVRCR